MEWIAIFLVYFVNRKLYNLYLLKIINSKLTAEVLVKATDVEKSIEEGNINSNTIFHRFFNFSAFQKRREVFFMMKK